MDFRRFSRVAERTRLLSTHSGSGMDVDARPSSFNILRKHYLKVQRLSEYIDETVSTARIQRVNQAAKSSDSLRKLLNTTYVCPNPQNYYDEEDENDVSNLSVGEYANQADVANDWEAKSNVSLSVRH
jgi:hypothetical protein